MGLSIAFCFCIVLIKNFDSLVTNAPPHLKKARRDALHMLERALYKVNGYNAVHSAISVDDSFLRVKEESFSLKSFENIYLLGFGKASVAMAQAIKEILPIKKGCIITNEKEKIEGINVYQASHPLPGKKNIHATEELLKIGEKASKKDLVILLISGGGSSFLCKPRISLNGLKKVTKMLMLAGCTIEELNTVRKHLSFVKGGQLAKKIKAKIIALIISDVIEDKLEFIASGPVVADTTTYSDAQYILKKYEIWGKIKEIDEIIMKGIKGEIDETPKEEFEHVHSFIIANNEMACKEAQKKAKGMGYYAKVVTTSLTGEAKELGKAIVEYAKIFPREKAALIFGGETTVVVKGKGKGGRNQELVLGAIKEIEGKDIVFLSCGTDGKDGNSDAAGAIIDGYSMERAKEKDLSPDVFLQNNDSFTFFEKLGDAIFTAQTGTNVMDVQIVIKQQPLS
ncbi:MAG: DUF4147 domain-containing protein [Thermoplasmata archaeon]|nr:MAG: DUF4147 domain-containing protein [Thermoplasmata archaeon]